MPRTRPARSTTRAARPNTTRPPLLPSARRWDTQHGSREGKRIPHREVGKALDLLLVGHKEGDGGNGTGFLYRTAGARDSELTPESRPT